MAGMREEIEKLVEAVRRGEIDTQAAMDRLARLPFRDLGFARVDLHRELRQGAPEVVLAEGKTTDEIVAIVGALVDGGAGSVLVSRADAEARSAVRTAFPEAEERERARLVWLAPALPEARGCV